LTAACCPKRDFYTHTPSPPKKRQQTFVLHAQKIARLLYCLLNKARQKSRPKKSGENGGKKVGKKCCKKGGEKVYS